MNTCLPVPKMLRHCMVKLSIIPPVLVKVVEEGKKVLIMIVQAQLTQAYYIVIGGTLNNEKLPTTLLHYSKPLSKQMRRNIYSDSNTLSIFKEELQSG